MQENELSANDLSDFCLYWAMVNDQIIERDMELEEKYREFLASTGKQHLGS